ncbi:MAG: hypothetical protein ABW189_00150 [Rickettsiales bacterium]
MNVRLTDVLLIWFSDSDFSSFWAELKKWQESQKASNRLNSDKKPASQAPQQPKASKKPASQPPQQQLKAATKLTSSDTRQQFYLPNPNGQPVQSQQSYVVRSQQSMIYPQGNQTNVASLSYPLQSTLPQVMPNIPIQSARPPQQPLPVSAAPPMTAKNIPIQSARPQQQPLPVSAAPPPPPPPPPSPPSVQNQLITLRQQFAVVSLRDEKNSHRINVQSHQISMLTGLIQELLLCDKIDIPKCFLMSAGATIQKIKSSSPSPCCSHDDSDGDD